MEMGKIKRQDFLMTPQTGLPDDTTSTQDFAKVVR